VKRIQLWLRSAPFNFARAVLQDGLLVPALRTYCAPYLVRGSAAPQKREPLIIVGNHSSHLDTPAILAALPRAVRHRTAVAAAEDYFFRRRLLGFAVSLTVGAFPFPRTGGLGIRRATALLQSGCNVLLFPEGTRSADGNPNEFRGGVGSLAHATGAPILPIGVVGSHALWPRGRRLPRRGRLEVRIGQPWRPDPSLSKSDICSEAARRVAALLGD
jgi:1-acyl-sn-glycerol-3-phosphate acyltransferase